MFARRMYGVQSSAVRDLLKHAQRPGIVSLAGGIPAPDLFDIEGLHAALEASVREGGTAVFQYGQTEGEPALREAIAELMRGRGVRCSAEEILVTAGSQQGLDLAARVLLDPGSTVVVERPSYLAALQTFALAEARVLSVPSDDEGMNVDALAERLRPGDARAIYVVPDFGNPTGRTLSLARRRQLVDLALRTGTMILEDDPYGALRFDGQRLPSLHALALEAGAPGRVLHLSSFSKILSPGLRLGWMVAPPEVLRQAALAKQAVDLHSCSLSQRLVMTYLASGRLQARMPLLAEAYRERRDALSAALRRHLGDHLQTNRPDGGMFLWGSVARGLDTARLLEIALEEGVIFVPGAAFHADEPETHTLRLSYSTVRPDTAETAAERLARAWRRFEAERPH
jgi:DNA-binding transcriptional MocR family regulator